LIKENFCKKVCYLDGKKNTEDKRIRKPKLEKGKERRKRKGKKKKLRKCDFIVNNGELVSEAKVGNLPGVQPRRRFFISVWMVGGGCIFSNFFSLYNTCRGNLCGFYSQSWGVYMLILGCNLKISLFVGHLFQFHFLSKIKGNFLYPKYELHDYIAAFEV